MLYQPELPALRSRARMRKGREREKDHVMECAWQDNNCLQLLLSDRESADVTGHLHILLR